MASRCVDVYVKLSSGRSVQYDVEPSTTIGCLIGMVAKEEGVEAKRVNLKYQGKVLTTSKTVGQYGVRPETILKTELVVAKTLALSIKLPDDVTEEMEISNLDSASDLFELVAELSGKDKGLLELKCKEQQIKNTTASKLSDLGIENGSDIDVTYREKKKSSDETNVEETKDEMDENDKEAVLSSFNTDGRHVEVVFSFDTTGSMYSYLGQVRKKLRECCTRLLQDIPTIRIGMIAHGDYCDQDTYVIRCVDLTSSVDTLVTFANDVPSTQGGDAPECYEWVLRKAQGLDWSEDSAKALVVIGDEIPHPPSYTDQNIQWRDEANILKGMGVKVYGVQADNKRDAGFFFEEIAEMTEGRHLKLNHFDIITDMFLAVCYREGSGELLEDFQQELEGEGRMTEQAKAMFDELKETDEEKKEKKMKKESSATQVENKRYVKEEWWDHSLRKDHKTPCYSYDESKDFWNSYTQASVEDSSTPSLKRSRSSRRRKLTKKSCSLM